MLVLKIEIRWTEDFHESALRGMEMKAKELDGKCDALMKYNSWLARVRLALNTPMESHNNDEKTAICQE